MRVILRRAPGVAVCLSLLVGVGAQEARGYPLDGYPNTGITRLEAFRIAQKNSGGKLLPSGDDLTTDKIVLSLQHRPGFTIPPADPALSRALRDELGRDARGYGVALLDISDPDHPRYAAVNPDTTMNPGSVGKLLIALGLFQTLADIQPEIRARRDLLRDTKVRTDEFVRKDSHEVPVWNLGDPKVLRRPLAEGESLTLYTFLDHMLSPSSNAAASIMAREAVLMKHFGARYPMSYEESRAYLDSAGRGVLSVRLKEVLQEPATRSGLSLGRFRQGSVFTREAKKRLPGTSSYATARGLLEFLVAMEKGQLVDPWSSKEIKKLLYVTDQRVRFAASPALRESALYFKSGSLYKCRPEAGFVCDKYQGNVWNFMNSVAVVEDTERNPPLRYMVVVMSNVLRKNSEAEHERLAAKIQALMEELHPQPSMKVSAELP